MIGTINISQIEFFAFHGCHESERAVGNRFTVDLHLDYDCQKAAETDSIEFALNYQNVCALIKEEMNKPCNLLEHLSANILNTLYVNFAQIIKAKITVAKHNPPIGCKMAYTSVTLEK